MASPTQTVTRRTSTTPVITLLVIAVLINYVDRGNLALAAPLLAKDWGLSASKLGILLSAFFWTYILLQVPVGWLVDRFQASSVLAAGFLAWSAATALTGLARGFAALFAMRLLLGVGEAVVFPASSKIFSECLEEKDRGLANGLLVAAIRWGTAVGAFGGGLLMAHIGWRKTFLAIGLVALLWLPAWQRWKPRRVVYEPLPPAGPPAQLPLHRPPPPLLGRLHRPPQRELSPLPAHELAPLLPRPRAPSLRILHGLDRRPPLCHGLHRRHRRRPVADLCIRRRISPTSARKWPMIAGLLLAAVSLVGCASAGPKTWFLFLCGAAIGCGLSCSGVYAVPQTLAGPRLAGRWVGMQNCVANFAGIVAPVLTGFLVQRSGHFSSALDVAALVAALGALAWVFGVRPSDEPRPLQDLALAEAPAP